MDSNDGDGDPWLAQDKLYHVLFCFFLSLLFYALVSLNRYPFLRRNSIWVASSLSLTAGAAKEAADQLGYFASAGASAKDAVADVIGVLVAALALFLWKCAQSGSESLQNRWVLPV